LWTGVCKQTLRRLTPDAYARPDESLGLEQQCGNGVAVLAQGGQSCEIIAAAATEGLGRLLVLQPLLPGTWARASCETTPRHGNRLDILAIEIVNNVPLIFKHTRQKGIGFGRPHQERL
jgi:hypothetical protein